jgi:hypothetical protein
MKKIILLCGVLFLMEACVTTTTPSTTQTPTAASPEAEAKAITSKMKTVLDLNDLQEEKIMLINVVNFKVIKKLRETNEIEKLNSTKAKYQSEIKDVLDEPQYQKFLIEFKDL